MRYILRDYARLPTQHTVQSILANKLPREIAAIVAQYAKDMERAELRREYTRIFMRAMQAPRLGNDFLESTAQDRRRTQTTNL